MNQTEYLTIIEGIFKYLLLFDWNKSENGLYLLFFILTLKVKTNWQWWTSSSYCRNYYDTIKNFLKNIRCYNLFKSNNSNQNDQLTIQIEVNKIKAKDRRRE